MRSMLLMLMLLLSAMSCKTKSEIVEPVVDDGTYLDGKMVFVKAMDLTEALEIAEAENKPLFVEFEADWCLPCKLMSEEVFTHKETADFFNDNFVKYKIDIEKGSGPNLKMLYGVNILPTLIFMNHKGRALSRNDGSLMHDNLMNLAHEALSNWEVESNAQ